MIKILCNCKKYLIREYFYAEGRDREVDMSTKDEAQLKKINERTMGFEWSDIAADTNERKVFECSQLKNRFWT